MGNSINGGETMKKFGTVILMISGVLVVTLAGSGLFFRVGADDSSFRQVVVFSEVFSLVLDNYVDPVEAERLMEGAYEGMLRGLDPHAAYLSPGELTAWKEPGGDLSAGPGLSVLKGFGALQVIAVDPGSPAEEAGLIPGDQIRVIEDVLLRDFSLEQATRLLRGPAGSTVRLQIVHPNKGFSREMMTLSRNPRLQVPYRLELSGSVLVLELRNLTRLDAGRLASELGDYRDQGIEQLLIDLRNAAEGTVRELQPVAALFHQGEAFRLVDRNGETLETVEIKSKGMAWSGELSLLVNGSTAGAAEGFARLLQVNGPVQVYGEETFGMASEPELFELPSGAGVLISSREWRLASGESWNEDGVIPDVAVLPEGRTYPERLLDQMTKTLEALGS
jgi:carboxyl-terminal processing protease